MRILLLLEKDGHNTFIHGSFQIPVDRTDEDSMGDAEESRRLARMSDPDEWDYGDVIQNLKNRGYIELPMIESWE